MSSQKCEEFVTQGSLNTDIYVKEYLKKRLPPFIESHTIPVMFWPDLATFHYGKKAKEFYDENEINILPKEVNPPNCPELQPIKKYLAQLKSHLKGSYLNIGSLPFRRRLWNEIMGIRCVEHNRKLEKYFCDAKYLLYWISHNKKTKICQYSGSKDREYITHIFD